MSFSFDNSSFLSEHPSTLPETTSHDGTQSQVLSDSGAEAVMLSPNISSSSILLPNGYQLAGKKKRPKTSWIWNHGYEVLHNGSSDPQWLCKHC
jgi:hypothetical protein